MVIRITVHVLQIVDKTSQQKHNTTQKHKLVSSTQ